MPVLFLDADDADGVVFDSLAICETLAERVMARPSMQERRAGAQQEIADGLPDQWKVEMVRNAR